MLRQSVAFASVIESIPETRVGQQFLPAGAIFRPVDVSDCAVCAGAALAYSTDPGDPAPGLTITTPGIGIRDGSSLASAQVLGEIFNPANTLVMASDLAEWSTGARRGVVVNAQTHAIVDILRAGTGGALISELANGIDPPPVADPPLVAAVSGHRQEIAFFGERDLQNQLVQGVRTYDFDLGQMMTWPIVSNEQLHDPVAVTYRPQDDAYWLLDRVQQAGHKTMRLVRARRGVVIEPMAEWEDRGRNENLALTTGADGSLVVSASRRERHAIAVLSFNAPSLTLTALYHGHDPIILPAFKSLVGITFATRSKNGAVVPQRQIARRQHEPDLDDDRDDGAQPAEALGRIF